MLWLNFKNKIQILIGIFLLYLTEKLLHFALVKAKPLLQKHLSWSILWERKRLQKTGHLSLGIF